MIKTCDCGGLYATERESFAGRPCYCPFPHTTEAYTVPGAEGLGTNTRRDFLRLGGLGVGSLMLTSQINCGGKSISGTIALISGAISELKLLYPNLAVLDKIVKLATDFNRDWVAGKFDSARTFFESLDTTVQQVITDLELNASARVKLLLASVAVGVRLIATLISEQATPSAMATAQVSAPKTVNRIKQLSNPADADWILRSVLK